MDCKSSAAGSSSNNGSKKPDTTGADKISGQKTGKTCHQCRQILVKPSIKCTKMRTPTKHCVLQYCCNCLVNRYTEEIEEETRVDWACPKCRGICNCSVCMKRRGETPTGRIVKQEQAPPPLVINEEHVVVTSTSETLEQNPILDLMVIDHVVKEETQEGCTNELPHGKELIIVAKIDVPIVDVVGEEEIEEGHNHGTELTSVVEIDFPADDIGFALQFMEFCCTFSDILKIEKARAKSILNDIVTGNTSSLVEFQIQLLKLIMELGEEFPISLDDDKTCWLKVLKECISGSTWVPKELIALDLETNDKYHNLGSSEKLRLLIFLCDETLETTKFRNWIDEQHAISLEGERLARAKLHAAKKKEKELKKELHDEVVKRTTAENDASFSISEHEAKVSELNAELRRAHDDKLEAKTLQPRDKQREPDVVRTETVLTDSKGCVCWRLKGCNNENFLLQGESCYDRKYINEKWFKLDDDEVQDINKQISSKRVKRQRECTTSVVAQEQPMTIVKQEPESSLTPTPEIEIEIVGPEITMDDIFNIVDANPWQYVDDDIFSGCDDIIADLGDL